MSKWIKCSERLPEPDKLVLGYREELGRFCCAVSGSEWTDEGGPIWNAGNLITGVGHVEPYSLEYEDEWPTHWMPLPPPPKEKSK